MFIVEMVTAIFIEYNGFPSFLDAVWADMPVGQQDGQTQWALLHMFWGWRAAL